MEFRGTYDHTLDAKNRLTVPSKFRQHFAKGVTLVILEPGLVELWPSDAYSATVRDTLAGLPPMHPDTRRLKRLLNANAFDTDLDGAYRLIVPPQCMAHANLDKHVVVTGSGDHAELWDRDAWHGHSADLRADAADILARSS